MTFIAIFTINFTFVIKSRILELITKNEKVPRLSMKIHGIEITKDQIKACENRMSGGDFTARNITKLAIANGVPAMSGEVLPKDRNYIANVLADRLIQRERKAGNIYFNDKFWMLKSI